MCDLKSQSLKLSNINIRTWILYFIFAVELRRQLSKKGENSEEIVEDEAVTEANSDDKEAIIEHLESRLNIAEEEHEAFIEKCKKLRSLIKFKCPAMFSFFCNHWTQNRQSHGF